MKFITLILLMFSFDSYSASWYLNQQYVDDKPQTLSGGKWVFIIDKPETSLDPNDKNNTLESRRIEIYHKGNKGKDRTSFSVYCDLKPSLFSMQNIIMQHGKEVTNVMWSCGPRK